MFNRLSVILPIKMLSITIWAQGKELQIDTVSLRGDVRGPLVLNSCFHKVFMQKHELEGGYEGGTDHRRQRYQEYQKVLK